MVPNWILLKSHWSILDCCVLVIFNEIAIIYYIKKSIEKLEDLAALYHEFFIIDEAPSQVPKENEKIRKSLTYSGKNTRGIVFILYQPQPIQAAEQQLLDKLLEHGLHIPPTEVVQCYAGDNAEYTLDELLQHFNPKVAVVWGYKQAEPHTIKQTGDMRVLYIHDVATYIPATDTKKQMWKLMQSATGA